VSVDVLIRPVSVYTYLRSQQGTKDTSNDRDYRSVTSTLEESSRMEKEDHKTSLLCRKRKTLMVSNRVVSRLGLGCRCVPRGSGIDRRARVRS